MLKKNKFKVIISSIIILLPILFGIIMWNDLPDIIATHWGADGNADGFSGKVFAVFGLPFIHLILHFVCLLFTSLDKKQKEQNQKALGMIFWILPVISLFTNGIMYRAAFGKEFDLTFFMPALLGVMFIFIGNYLPKVKQNRTLGIKISWTLNNEENWNKTHRFGGKVWVVGGLILLLSIFLPLTAMVWVMVCVIAAMVIIPIVYSYSIYKQHQKEGIIYDAAPRSGAEKIAVRITAIIVPIIFVVVAILMFTGSIEVKCKDTALTINATYWTDLKIDYSEIDTIEYRKDLDVGVRTSGFGSPRLSMGIFKNDEFGSYTLYSYTGAKEHIVLTSGEKTLVIGMSDTKETQAIYEAMIKKVGE
ncbi:MAG: SdpI family protein [Clostridia bacterium]|nr:SdpI family protein [Clostridia bacterium]